MKTTSSELNSNTKPNNSTTIIKTSLNNSFSDTDNSMSGTDRYKRYLIDKLLNESITSTQLLKQSAANTTNNNDSIGISNIITTNNTNGTTNNNNNLADSKEDLNSETGTYIIDDHLDRPDSAQNNNYEIDLKQSTNTIDLISARAAIDETFGVIKPAIDDVSVSSTATNTPTSTPKRQTQKMIRARNQTYSLSKDLIIGDNAPQQQQANNEEEKNQKTNEIEAEEQQQQQQQPISILKKTTTYDVIPSDLNDDAKSDLNESTVSSKVIGTELLLGDTERLMEQIKLRRFEKRQSMKARLLSANSNLNQSRSSSSSCSSSTTMLSNQQKDQDDSASETTNQFKSKCWIIPCKEDDPVSEPSMLAHQNDESYFNSTRATVNASQDKSISSQIKNQSRKNGGMAFEFILDDNNNHSTPSPVITNNKNSKNEYIIDDDDESLANSMTRSVTSYASIRRSTLAKSTDSSALSTSTSITQNSGAPTTPKSNLTQMSLGAKIQARAKENAAGTTTVSPTNTSENLDKTNKNRQSIKRISSDSTHLQLSNITASTNNAVSSPSHYMNRTLMLRQQTAKARRNSDNKSDLLSELSPSAKTTAQKTSLTLNGVLKKSASNAATSSMTSIRTSMTSSLANKSLSNLTNVSLTSPSTNKKKSSSRSNSREAASSSSSSTNHNSSLMTTSLTLPNGTNSLPGHNDHRDSFIRRKAYDPVKAVELEKQKKKEEQIKRKSLLLEQQQQLKIVEDSDLKATNLNQSIDENTVCDSFNSLPIHSLNSSKQIKPKALNHSVSFDDQINNTSISSINSSSTSSSNSSNNNSSSNNSSKPEEEPSTYEKILQSTLQRLCIRLIQMSTGVLDKIGDNSSSKLNESNTLLNSIGSTELERMQQLAKLVHSMQLVHDHVQIIDSTLFNPKPEEAYMKELSRLRQELASLNSSSLAHHNNTNNNHQLN